MGRGRGSRSETVRGAVRAGIVETRMICNGWWVHSSRNVRW